MRHNPLNIPIIDSLLKETWHSGLFGKEYKDVTRNIYVIHHPIYNQKLTYFSELLYHVREALGDWNIPKKTLKIVLEQEQKEWKPKYETAQKGK